MKISDKILQTIKEISKERKIKEVDVTWHQISIKLAEKSILTQKNGR